MVADLVSIQPSELKFPFELRKQVSCTLRLINITGDYVAFKVKTTAPKLYAVRPSVGLVAPQTSAEIVVTMQAQKESPADLICKDKFLVQTVTVSSNSPKDISQEVFQKENGRDIREAKLKVVYVPPAQPPSPVAESADEGIQSPHSEGDFLDTNIKDVNEMKAKLLEARQSLAAVTEERNRALQIQQKLQKDLSIAVKEKDEKSLAAKRGRQIPKKGGWSFFHILIFVFFAFMMGYFYGKAPTPVAGTAPPTAEL